MFRERRACSTVRRGDAMGFEPKRPVLTVEVMEKRKCQAIGRPLEGATLFKQAGARDDNEFGGKEPGGFQAGIVSQSVPYRQFDRLSLQIDRAVAGLHRDFNIR